MGCEKATIQPVNLDFALKTHYQQIQSKKTGAARVQLRQFMALNGESSQPLFLMGLSYHKEKKYTKAVEWFEKSADFSNSLDRYPATWHFLGWSYYYLGDAENAKNAFSQFLQYHPKEGDSLFGLGLIAMADGDLNGASLLFRESIPAQIGQPKGQAKAMARLGDVLVLQKDLLSAKKLYLRAVQLDPNLYEAWFRLANTFKHDDQSLFHQYIENSREAKGRVLQSRHQTRFPE